MSNGIDIIIGAEVGGAIRGLDQFEQRLRTTAAAGQSFGKGVDSFSKSLPKLTQNTNQANTALLNFGRVVQDAPYGIIGIANNIDPLLQSFQSLKASTGTTGGALKALGSSLIGPAGLGIAVSLVTSALVLFGDKLFGSSKAAKEAKSAADQLKDSIKGIFTEQAREAAEVGSFIAILKSETETRERKLSAIKELQRIQPEVFNNLKLEGNAVIGLDNAYKGYLENLKTVIAAKIKQAQLEAKITELLKAQGLTQTASEKALTDATDKFINSQVERAKKAGGAEGLSFVESVIGKKEKRKQALGQLEGDINQLVKDLTELSKGVKVPTLKIKPEKVTIDEQFDKIIKLDKPIPIEATINFKELNFVLLGGDLLTLKEKAESNITKSIQKLVVKPNIQFSAEYLNNQEALRQIREFSLAISDTLNSGLESAAIEGFSAFADGIGQALAGGDIANAFAGFAGAIGGALQEMGKQIISIGVAAIAAKKALTALFTNPALAIAAGVGLIAVGGAMKSALSKSFGGFREKGGPVFGGSAYVVGEKGPELFVPGSSGVIVPNGGRNPGAISMGGGGSIFGNQRQVVRGQNILLAYARTNRSQGRLGRG